MSGGGFARTPRVSCHAHWQAAPGRRATREGRFAEAVQQLLSRLRPVLVGPAASHGRASPVVVHCFFSYFPVVCSFFGFFRAVGCLLRRCATLSCLPSTPSSFLSFALFDHRHTHFHHYPPPIGEGGRSPACVCLGFPSPPPASLAPAWPCRPGPDDGGAAHASSLRRGWLSS